MNRTNQTEFTKLVIKLNEQKERLQQKFDGRTTTVAELASTHGVAACTMQRALDGLGIKRTHSGDVKQPVYTKNILTVLVRIAKELGVNYDEIKPYVD